jgi:hypothetical protein
VAAKYSETEHEDSLSEEMRNYEQDVGEVY